MNVDKIVNTQAGIDKLLDFVDTNIVHIAANPVPMIRHLVHHFSICFAEPIVTLKEVAMPINMGHDQFLICQPVALHQIGIAGIVVDHHFVNFLQTVVIPLAELFVLHPKTPMRIPDWKSTFGCNRVEPIGVDHFKNRGEKVEPVATCVPFNLALHVGKVLRQFMKFCTTHKSQPVFGERSLKAMSYRAGGCEFDATT